MLGWLGFPTKREKSPSREALLRAVPVRNAAVQESPAGRGLRLTGQVAGGGWRQMLGARRDKSFELDELGAFVWEGIDGKRTVEQTIVRFAEQKRVNLREAEVAVLAFLKMLTRRGLIGLAAEKIEPPRPKARRRKN